MSNLHNVQQNDEAPKTNTALEMIGNSVSVLRKAQRTTPLFDPTRAENRFVFFSRKDVCGNSSSSSDDYPPP